MPTRYSTAGQRLTANAVGTAFSAGGYLSIYTGDQATSPNDAATGTLLATLTLAPGAFAAALDDGTIAVSGIASAPILASGSPGWYRLWRAGDTSPDAQALTSDVRIDGTATGPDGEGDVLLSSDTLIEGGSITLNGFRVVFPGV